MFDLFSDPVKVAQQLEIIFSEFGFATWETLYSLALQVLFSYVIGLPLGVILVTGADPAAMRDAARAARELGPQFDRVICAGGDGTLSETVTGLMSLSQPPLLGYIPFGSTNDCAANLDLPKAPPLAALTAGEKVQLVGFGSFEVKARAERIGRNPRTKEEIKIPASKVPVFKAGKALKDAVSK